MNKNIEKEKIEAIALDVGKEYGFKTVKVELSKFRDFKANWKRTNQWITFKMSDYIVGASDEVIEDLFRRLYSSMLGKGEYQSKKFVEYFYSKEFTEKHRATYLKRCKVNAPPYKMIDGDIQVYLIPFTKNCATIYSAFFKTIFINDRLKDAPQVVIDTLINDTYNTLQEIKKNFGLDCESAYIDPKDIEETENYLEEVEIEW